MIATAAARMPDTTRSRRRRLGPWIAVGIVLVIVGVVGGFLAQAGQWAQRGTLDPESAGPNGARAVVQVLREQGIDVRVVRDRDAAASALGPDATLALPDAPGLSDDSVRELTGAAGGVVLLEPRSRTLRLLLDGSGLAGVAGSDPVVPACALSAARTAGPIVAGDLYTAGDDVTACYPAEGGHALLSAADGSIVAVDGRAILANDAVAQAGNAALALALLGERPTLVWYVPSLADTDAAGAPTLGELTPEWVTPAILLLLAAGLAAAVWRGRRFGPLVAETLPVTVRAGETTEGRGRLYARAADPGHALDGLRVAVAARLGRLLALGPSAAAVTVADAAADVVGLDRAAARRILVDDVPRTDRELVDLTDRLLDLEARVRAAVRPEGTPR